MHPLRNKAIALRKKGKSYGEIEKELEIKRSTLSYMLRQVQITPEGEERLKRRVQNNQKRFIKLNADISEQQKKEWCSKGGKACWERHGERLAANLRLGFEKSLTTYRKDELPIKEILEKLYNTRFQKEIVLGQAVDFVSADLLIEHSSDGTRGLQEVITRFEKLGSDLRRKIAYVDTIQLGLKRRIRLEAVTDEILDYRELRALA